MNIRYRRVARLKELERRRIFKKSQKAVRDFNQAMHGVKNVWESFEIDIARTFGKRNPHDPEI